VDNSKSTVKSPPSRPLGGPLGGPKNWWTAADVETVIELCVDGKDPQQIFDDKKFPDRTFESIKGTFYKLRREKVVVRDPNGGWIRNGQAMIGVPNVSGL
jgi:hypothetical protein